MLGRLFGRLLVVLLHFLQFLRTQFFRIWHSAWMDRLRRPLPSPGNYSPKTRLIAVSIVRVWPSEVASFLLTHGIPVREAPPYDIKQMAGQKYYPPKILTPSRNAIYFRRLDRIQADQHGLRLSAAVTNRVRKITWFLDDKIIYEGDPLEDRIINPPPGQHRLTLLDEVGGKDEMMLVVKDFREAE